MCVLPLVIPVGGSQVLMEWLACRHGRCWWWCATQILWDPFYQFSDHPQLLLRKLLPTSVIFSRRLALAKWNCFARKFWELYRSTHSYWCPVVSNRLGLGVTKALLLFFMAGWTLPGNLCPTAPHGIGMKLDMTQIHIPVPFFPVPSCYPHSLSPESPHWVTHVHDDSCLSQGYFCAPFLRQTQFSKGNRVDCQTNSSKPCFKKQWPFCWYFLCPQHSIKHFIYMLSVLLTLRLFYSWRNWA